MRSGSVTTILSGGRFPAVGVVVAGVMIGTRVLAGLALVPAPATVLALLAAVLVTGGFHEDGLADVSDGLGAHVSTERKLEILKDSRIGTFGALAVAFMVVLPVVVLAPLSEADFARAALAGHVLGRWSTLSQSWLLPAAAPGGSGALLRASPVVVLGGSVFAVAATLAACGIRPGLIVLAVAAGVTALGGLLCVRVLGGVTGDTYGAVNKAVEAVELATYVALGAALS